MNIFLKVCHFLYKHGHWTVSGRVSVALLNLLLSVALTKLMTVDEYGNYQYYLSFFLLLEFFSTPGASSAVVKYVALGYDWSCDYLLKLRLKYSLLASIVFIFFGLYNIFVGNIFESLIYFAFAIIFPFYHSYDLFASFYRIFKISFN